MNPLQRIRAGEYRLGDAVIRDAYDPSGAPHTRTVTLTRDRWVVTLKGLYVGRFDRMRDAVRAVRHLGGAQ